MNAYLFRGTSVPVRVSLVPYEKVPTNMYICKGYVKDRFPYTWAIFIIKFEFILSIRVSFVLVGFDGRLWRCVAILVVEEWADQMGRLKTFCIKIGNIERNRAESREGSSTLAESPRVTIFSILMGWRSFWCSKMIGCWRKCVR